MEANESQSACLLEKPHPLLCDSLAATRRKRREIRLLRKLACTPTLTKGLNVIQQGVPTKRAGLRPVYGCNSFYRLDGGVHAEEACSGDLTKISAEEKVSNLVADGLIRSRSFPPEGWQTSEYIRHLSRIGRSLDKRERNSAVTVGGGGQCQIRSACSLGPTDGLTASLHLSKTMAGCLSQQSTRNGGSENCCSVVNLRRKEEAASHMDTEQPDVVNTMAAEAVTDGLFLAGKTALLQSVEGNLLNSCEKVALEVEVRQVRREVNCPPSGKVLICGRRRDMEDTAAIVPSFVQLPKGVASSGSSPCDLHFYGVYDGHGGSQASSYCAERLHHALAEEIVTLSMTEESSGIKEWQIAMLSCFAKVDREVGGVCPYGTCDDVDSSAGCCSGTIAPENVGTTAVVAVVSSSQIVLANCGDSRAVLSRGGRSIPLSQDHKPERVDETSRIEAAGGRVIAWKGYRVAALLAVSRAIGDRYLKRYVISEPDVVCLERTQEDECLILASDGLWDVIDNDTACDVARRCLASARGRERRTTSRREDLASATAAATLVKLACGKGSQDNISVVVVDLSCERQ